MKKNNKKRTIILLSILVFLSVLIPIFANMIKHYQIDSNNSYISSELDITSYNIVLDVNKNNKYDVTEIVTVNISDKGINGIYRIVPKWQHYYINNKQKSIKGDITNLHVIGEKFELTNRNDYQEIKIGSEKVSTSIGEHVYTIKYRYNAGIDLNNGFDILAFNLFDNYNETKIDNLNITVNMPKSFSGNVKFLNKDVDITDKVNFKVENNTLKANLTNYELVNSLTLVMTLEDNYFIGGTYNYGFLSLSLCLIIVIISIIGFITWIMYGKDNDKRVQTVEFYAPDNLDPAEIGYIYGEHNIKKLLTSLLISLASKGYISIKKENNKYIAIKQVSKIPLSILEQILYQDLLKNAQSVVIDNFDFSLISNKISSYLDQVVYKKTNDLEAKKKTDTIFKFLILSVVIWLISYLFIKDLNPKYNFIYLISFVSIFATGLFSIIMERKNALGEILYARIRGFKEFLETTEKATLESQVEKNPNYFYDILPYTYVLGISEKWIAKFQKENIINMDINNINTYTNEIFMII